jgi:hypothetical protein
MAHLIMKYMDKLEIHQRPMHCTDPKRDVLYVKENNIWDKDTWKLDNVREMILGAEIEKLSMRNLEYLSSKESRKQEESGEASFNEHDLRILVNSGGFNSVNKVEELIRKVSKRVIIDKDCFTISKIRTSK